MQKLIDTLVNITKQGAEEESVNQHQFRRVQARLLHAQIQNELLIGLFTTIIVCAIFWEAVPPYILLVWSISVLFMYGWRSLFVSEKYSQSSNEDVHIWGRQYVFASVLSGCLWGSLYYITASFGDSSHLVFTMFILVIITLSAYTSMQSSPGTFVGFAIPALLPITVAVMARKEYIYLAYGIATVMLFLVMLAASRNMRVLLFNSIRLSSHNKELIHKLLAARESTETVNSKLENANRELQTQIEERRRAEDRIRESKERIQAIFDGMQDTIYQADLDGRITWITPSVRHLLGYDPSEILECNIRDFYADPQGHVKHNQALDRNFGNLQHYETMLVHRDGSPVWISENSFYKYDELGGILGYEATLRDITTLKQTKEALHMEQERAYVTLGSIGDGVIAMTLDGKIEYMNIVAEQGTGWDLEESRGRFLSDIFRIVDEKTLKPVPDPVQLCLDEGKTIMLPGYLLLIHRHLNQRMSIEVNASPIRNMESEISGVVLVFHDVSELRSLAQMTYHATHDSLTGLINRREFEKRVHYALENSREKDIRYSLCYMDLDNFKIVNDTCGHIAGDELLKQVTTNLRITLREGDTLARLGGDEFGILFAGCSIQAARRLAENIRKSIEDYRFVWDDKSFRIGASIGLAPITSDSATMSEVLSAADSACYVAKENGRNRIHVYEPNDQEFMLQQGQMLWVQRVQQVLENNRFSLYFQAIEPVTRDINNAEKLRGEVLIRMLDDDNNLIGPDYFIPAAERYSLMPSIDQWVLENTLAILTRDLDTVIERVDACSINLSGQSLSDDRFMKTLIDMIIDTGIPPELLCFEITETAVISNLSNATHLISKLRAMGCHFALDDFGVGLSSFGYLKNLAVDYLKLDGCFIKHMTRDNIDHAMVRSINHIGQTMRIKTIAEFVENEETLQALREIGVDFAQGYHIAKPVPLAEAIYGCKEEQLRLASSNRS